MERGEREPPRRRVVIELANALQIHGAERYNFILAADYAPDELIPMDASAILVSRAMDSPGLTTAEKAELRGIILTLADHWIRLGDARTQRTAEVPMQQE
jgi:hypothetical protein